MQILVRSRGNEIHLLLSASPTDTIDSLKQQISLQTTISPHHLRLFSGFLELKNSSSLTSCGLSASAELELEATNVVFIETLKGLHIPLEVEFTETIAEIKGKLREKLGSSEEELRLVFAGKELRDEQTLGECNVNSGWTLHLMETSKSLSFKRSGTGNGSNLAKSEDLRGSNQLEAADLQRCATISHPPLTGSPRQSLPAIPDPQIGEFQPYLDVSLPEDSQSDDFVYESFAEEIPTGLCQLSFVGALPSDREEIAAFPMSFIDKPPPKGCEPLVGKKLGVEIDQNATIRSLKDTIQARIGMSVPIEALIFEEYELQDGFTLADYRIRPECTVFAVIPRDINPDLLKIRHCRPVSCTTFSQARSPTAKSASHLSPPSSNMSIRIKTTSGETIDLIARSYYTVSSLKDKIANLKGFPASQQQLLYANKPLSDENHLSDYGIQQGDMLFLLLKYAGGMTIFVQFCFNSLESVVRKQLVKSGLVYRKVKPGISFSSRCRNASCRAFGDYIVVNKGYGGFDIARISGNLPCPVCRSLAEPSTNCRFYKAMWVFQGQIEDGEVVTRKGRTEGSLYYTYREGSTVKWRYLHVTVSRAY